jgi:hypothetical protein
VIRRRNYLKRPRRQRRPGRLLIGSVTHIRNRPVRPWSHRRFQRRALIMTLAGIVAGEASGGFLVAYIVSRGDPLWLACSRWAMHIAEGDATLVWLVAAWGLYRKRRYRRRRFQPGTWERPHP